MRSILFPLGIFLLSFSALAADNQELGLLVGAISATGRTAEPGGPVTIGAGAALSATYARDIHTFKVKYAEVMGEVNLTVSPWQDVTSPATAAIKHYGGLYVTPGIRVKFYPHNKLSPWIVGGGGYALYFQSSQNQAGASISGARAASGGAIEVGGGADFIATPRLTLRGEVRDYLTQSPPYNVPVAGFGQFNFVASVGVVLNVGKK